MELVLSHSDFGRKKNCVKNQAIKKKKKIENLDDKEENRRLGFTGSEFE